MVLLSISRLQNIILYWLQYFEVKTIKIFYISEWALVNFSISYKLTDFSAAYK